MSVALKSVLVIKFYFVFHTGLLEKGIWSMCDCSV